MKNYNREHDGHCPHSGDDDTWDAADDIDEIRELLNKLRADPDANKVKPMNLNPGSDAAIARGCACAVLDNNYGAGIGKTTWTPESGFGDLFWVNEECPLHGSDRPLGF